MAIKTGDTVNITYKLKEKDKVRLQSFEGVVIGTSGSGDRQTITVRKISYGVGVEKIFPINSPFIDNIEVVKKGKPRKSKLYYLRKRVGKKATKVKDKTEKEKPKKAK